MKKLLVLLALAGLAYWLVKDRLGLMVTGSLSFVLLATGTLPGGEPDEFVFTEAPPAADAEAPAAPPPAS